MFIIVMAALLLLAARISDKYKKSMSQCLPVVTSLLILAMYLLAFFRGLKLIGAVAALVIIYVIVATVKDDDTALGTVFRKILGAGTIMFVTSVALVTFATSGQIFTWWDDINFWSSDAKQLFFLSGFPGKYGNVSPEFGDYPPVTSLVKWLFLQIKPGEYSESLQFAGYFFLNGVYLLPLFDRFESCIKRAVHGTTKRLTFGVLSFAAVFLFPGVFNGILYYGTPADITMAVIYGALLLTIMDSEEHGDLYYFGSIGLYTSVLLLTKSVGFEWAAFALVFYALFGRRSRKIFASVFTAAAFISSWLLFCLINRRVAKLTGAGIKMATSGNYVPPENTADKLSYFFEGFWLLPMHADHNITIDLSTGAAVVLIFLLVFVLFKKGILERKEFRKLLVFLAISGALAYGIVFAAHITIFQTEDQYLDAYAMAVSISRYCAPFALGSLYLVMGIMLDRAGTSSAVVKCGAALSVCLLLIFLTADYSGVYRYLVGYRDSVSENEKYVSDMVGEDGRLIVESVSDEEYWGKRVLVLRDGHTYYWVHNTYISKEASPTALVYDGFLTEQDTKDTILQKLKDSHAKYFYVEDNEGISYELFSQVLGDEKFEPGKVYKIEGNVY